MTTIHLIIIIVWDPHKVKRIHLIFQIMIMISRARLNINHNHMQSLKKVLNQQEKAETNLKQWLQVTNNNLLRCKYSMISRHRERKVGIYSQMKKSNKVSILETMMNFKFREKQSHLRMREMLTRSINLRTINWQKNTHKIFLKNIRVLITLPIWSHKRKISL